VNALTAAIARRLFTVSHVSLVNLLARGDVVPELLQEACTPDRLAAALRTLLDDPAIVTRQRTAFHDALASLRPSAAPPSAAAPSAPAPAVVRGLLDKACPPHPPARARDAVGHRQRRGKSPASSGSVHQDSRMIEHRSKKCRMLGSERVVVLPRHFLH